jgi:hypothetical protein
MKVYELISRLSELPENLDVILDGEDGVNPDIIDVRVSVGGFTAELIPGW